jgi:predicted dehydrogenase
MNRRDLLQKLSLSFLSTKLPLSMSGAVLPARRAEASPSPTPIAANDRIRAGIIGAGSRGLELVRQLLRVPGVELAGACDVYEPRLREVNDLVGSTVPAYRDHRELLDRKDIDCILIATPPLFHAEYAIAAMKNGKPVYGEKTLGFSPQDSRDAVDTVRRTGQIFQIGHQLRYASWVKESVKRVQNGLIGEPTQIYAYWHRSDDWRRSVPDPKLEHLFNWRLYQESSGGLLEELGSHHIDIANWVFGDQPESVLGSSSIAVHHDGRTVGDNVQAVFSYSKGRSMFFSSITDNALMADQLWIYGTEGSVQITLEDATFYSPARKSITAASHSEIVQKGVETGPSFQTNWELPYRGPGERMHMEPGENPTLVACRSFIESVRQKSEPFANVDVGYRSAIACSIGKQAIAEGRSVKIPRWSSTSAHSRA